MVDIKCKHLTIGRFHGDAISGLTIYFARDDIFEANRCDV